MKYTRTRYLTAVEIQKIHDSIIEKSGGLPDIKPEGFGQLEYIAEHIQDEDYFPTKVRKMAKLLSFLTRMHVFNDGNKRTAVMATAFMAHINGVSDRVVISMALHLKTLPSKIIMGKILRTEIDVAGAIYDAVKEVVESKDMRIEEGENGSVLGI